MKGKGKQETRNKAEDEKKTAPHFSHQCGRHERTGLFEARISISILVFPPPAPHEYLPPLPSAPATVIPLQEGSKIPSRSVPSQILRGVLLLLSCRRRRLSMHQPPFVTKGGLPQVFASPCPHRLPATFSTPSSHFSRPHWLSLRRNISRFGFEILVLSTYRDVVYNLCRSCRPDFV